MKVAVGLSGGVDSSVAAALLKEEGHEVIGLTMKVWEEDSSGNEEIKPACIGPAEKEDIENAGKVAEMLGIPFKVVDLMDEYNKVVLSYFKSEYMEGRTPNPCIRCNHEIKFKALVEKAERSGLDFDYFATGHYARVAKDEQTGRFLLKKAEFLRKDQSYFLAMLEQKQLSRIQFPLSDYTKERVRDKARELGLITSEKPESQDFYSGDYADLFDVLPEPGDIITTEGKVLGKHKGIIYYTIGQRRGLGVSYSEPLYVVDIDSKTNQVIVGTEDKLYKDYLIATNPNWISIEKLTEPMKVQVKIRYKHSGSEAEIFPLEDGSVKVQFYQPMKSVTPGQIAVFYDGDVVVGAGAIEKFQTVSIKK